MSCGLGHVPAALAVARLSCAVNCSMVAAVQGKMEEGLHQPQLGGRSAQEQLAWRHR